MAHLLEVVQFPTMFAVRTLVVFTSVPMLLLYLPKLSLTHPQCLDFQPPYEDNQVNKLNTVIPINYVNSKETNDRQDID